MDDIRYSALKKKRIINLNDGSDLGYATDARLNVATGALIALVIGGQTRFFGLFGGGEEREIHFAAIKKIGEDVILADLPPMPHERREEKLIRWV